MKLLKIITGLIFSFTVLSCTTIPGVKSPASGTSTTDSPLEKPSGRTSVKIAVDEMDLLLAELDENRSVIARDIDNREWLMAYINDSADKDMLIVQNIYENLKYRDWSTEEKSEYLNHYFFIAEDGTPSGMLMDMRNSVWDELSYLLKNSRLLQETPWMVRDFYDERSEFSYWYLTYLAKIYYPFWIDETILPAMLALIPEDRIKGITYLWIKKPDSLCDMKKEIVDTGYPWNKILYLLEMSRYIQDQLSLTNQSKTGKNSMKAYTCIF